ncbi:MAG: class A beta-lactamase [Planctomycetes bacterium]|nr:class A beta-lactamase [Planctomycetota bacterium]MBI3848177.1 class A beta-lactamase [Planctomycetota bacterium]
MRAAILGGFCAVVLGCVEAKTQAVREVETPSDPLSREFARQESTTGGTLGVAVVHVESGRRASWRGGERFPMASVFKLPVAIQVLTLVDRGEISLDRRVTLDEHDLRPGYSPIAASFTGQPVTLSVRELLERMTGDSDNSAADVLVTLAGGPRAVTDRMRALGIDGIDVSRTERELCGDGSGIRELPAHDEWTLARYDALAAAVSPIDRAAAEARYANDPRDTATPDAMARLLLRVQRRDLLEPSSAALLIDWLERSKTGSTMIRAGVPAGTRVGDRSGGMAGTRNDVGIVTLPGGAGHLVIAAFVKASSKEFAEREAVIAKVARRAYDAFATTPATP